jgi:hypothetical protein
MNILASHGSTRQQSAAGILPAIKHFQAQNNRTPACPRHDSVSSNA